MPQGYFFHGFKELTHGSHGDRNAKQSLRSILTFRSIQLARSFRRPSLRYLVACGGDHGAHAKLDRQSQSVAIQFNARTDICSNSTPARREARTCVTRTAHSPGFEYGRAQEVPATVKLMRYTLPKPLLRMSSNHAAGALLILLS
jgi:hypothetical protein